MMIREGVNVFPFRRRSQAFQVDDDPQGVAACEIQVLIKWAARLKAEGRMPEEVERSFQQLFTSLWTTSVPGLKRER
jgi:hypothetical protein